MAVEGNVCKNCPCDLTLMYLVSQTAHWEIGPINDRYNIFFPHKGDSLVALVSTDKPVWEIGIKSDTKKQKSR